MYSTEMKSKSRRLKRRESVFYDSYLSYQKHQYLERKSKIPTDEELQLSGAESHHRTKLSCLTPKETTHLSKNSPSQPKTEFQEFQNTLLKTLNIILSLILHPDNYISTHFYIPSLYFQPHFWYLLQIRSTISKLSKFGCKTSYKQTHSQRFPNEYIAAKIDIAHIKYCQFKPIFQSTEFSVNAKQVLFQKRIEPFLSDEKLTESNRKYTNSTIRFSEALTKLHDKFRADLEICRLQVVVKLSNEYFESFDEFDL